MELFCHLNFLQQNIFNIIWHFSFQIFKLIFFAISTLPIKDKMVFFMFDAVKKNYKMFSIIMDTLWWLVGMCLVYLNFKLKQFEHDQFLSCVSAAQSFRHIILVVVLFSSSSCCHVTIQEINFQWVLQSETCY